MSIELTHYIERRILNLLSFAMELKNQLPYSSVNFVLSNQIARMIRFTEKTYGKAKQAQRGEEFVALINQVRRQARETKYWIKILKEAEGRKPYNTIGFLEDESEALIRIFGRIISIKNSPN